MQNKWLIIIVLTTLNLNVMAQKEKKYTEIKTERISDTIHISAESLWDIISNPNMATWSTLLDSTKHFGPEVFEGVPWSKRVSVVNSKGHHESHEDLMVYDPIHLKIKFASTKFPNFIISNETHWEVLDLGNNQSVMKITTLMFMKKTQGLFLKKPMIKAIDKNGKQILNDLKYYAENQEPSPAKKNRIETLEASGRNREKNYKVITKTLSKSINVSADSLWRICREFDKTAEWTSTLNHSYGTGESIHEGASCSKRVCETSFGKGNKVVEELTMFSDERRELSYNLTDGAPGFIVLAKNHWKIIEIAPNQSKIEMYLTMHMKKFQGFFLSDIISNQAEKQVSIVLNELKTYAETGDVSKEKKIQLKKRLEKYK